MVMLIAIEGRLTRVVTLAPIEHPIAEDAKEANRSTVIGCGSACVLFRAMFNACMILYNVVRLAPITPGPRIISYRTVNCNYILGSEGGLVNSVSPSLLMCFGELPTGS